LFNGEWLRFIRMLTLLFRAYVFENYRLFVMLVWSAFILFFAAIASVISWIFALIIVLVGVGLFTKVVRFAQRYKHRLVRKGDIVEYALIDESSMIQQFARTKVRYPLTQKEMRLTSLFAPEDVGYYQHFFLVEAGEKSIAIAFEWITSIETQLVP